MKNDKKYEAPEYPSFIARKPSKLTGYGVALFGGGMITVIVVALLAIIDFFGALAIVILGGATALTGVIIGMAGVLKDRQK